MNNYNNVKPFAFVYNGVEKAFFYYIRLKKNMKLLKFLKLISIIKIYKKK